VFHNVPFSSARLPYPLVACLTSLGNSLQTGTYGEISALMEATLALLPLITNKKKELITERLGLMSQRTSRELFRFVDENIANPDLDPRSAARYLGSSVRNIHRQFAVMGTTFGTYVMSKRLDGVRRELNLEESKKVPVFMIAFRWGFNDLSTFFRAFKKRFDCTPRQSRSDN
jgi:AraC family transcriptional regulator, positive regulator of tynA and feaB